MIILLPKGANPVLFSTEHINHIRSVAGIDHIGLGGDYNGITMYVPKFP